MSGSSSSSSSSSSSRWRSLGLEKEQQWQQRKWERARWPGPCQGPEELPQHLRRPTAACKEPLVCHDMVVQNALYTGDLTEVQRHFSEHAEVNLVIEAKSHDLRWTSHKWGKKNWGRRRVKRGGWFHWVGVGCSGCLLWPKEWRVGRGGCAVPVHGG